MPEGAKLRAIIGPHAGFRFSGPTAAWGYRNINANNYDRVVLLGPSHKVYLDFMATTSATHYETPLGNIRIDRDNVVDLCKRHKEYIQEIDLDYEENEHSLEMHCPYIAKVFKDAEKDFVMVPIMVG